MRSWLGPRRPCRGCFPPRPLNKRRAGQCGDEVQHKVHLASPGEPPTPGMNALSFQECCELSNSCCCSVAKCCLTLYDLMDCSTPGLPVHHYLPEFVQTHVR